MDRRIVIEGRKVHGVGYRPLLLRGARRAGLERYEAENVYVNGSEAVDVSFGGGEKEVNAFFEFCRSARPQGALVSRVREEKPPEKVLPIDEYDKILAAEQQSTMVSSGLEMISMHKETLGLQKETIGYQKETLGLQKETLGLQKETLGLQKETVGLLKENTGRLDSFHSDTIQRFDVVDAKYGKIAGNLERILEEMKQERQEARKSTERIITMIARMKGGVVTERTAVYRASKKAKKSR